MNKYLHIKLTGSLLKGIENYKDEKPIIIIKSENWIVTEYNRRQQSMVATKPEQR